MFINSYYIYYYLNLIVCILTIVFYSVFSNLTIQKLKKNFFVCKNLKLERINKFNDKQNFAIKLNFYDQRISYPCNLYPRNSYHYYKIF